MVVFCIAAAVPRMRQAVGVDAAAAILLHQMLGDEVSTWPKQHTVQLRISNAGCMMQLQKEEKGSQRAIQWRFGLRTMNRRKRG